MKMLAFLTLAACTLASPVLCFAQSNHSEVTRAQVRAELVRLEQVGYNLGPQEDYPENIMAAEPRLNAEQGQQLAGQAVGGAGESGTSAAGASAVHSADGRSVYFGH
jgi:hypothetical protein